MTDAHSIMEEADPAQLARRLHETNLQRAPLWARYGPGGTFDHQRKTLLCTIADGIRLGATEKLTEAAIDQKAHIDPRYAALLDSALEERTVLARFDADALLIEQRIRHLRDESYAERHTP